MAITHVAPPPLPSSVLLVNEVKSITISNVQFVVPVAPEVADIFVLEDGEWKPIQSVAVAE